jgi:CheY-like chemotaxis protein
MEPLNVLVVDDEFFICEVLAEILQLKGYKTTTTTDTHEALELFEKERNIILYSLITGCRISVGLN